MRGRRSGNPPMSKTLRITDPGHGMAIATHLMMIILGSLLLTGVASATKLGAWLGPVGFAGWGIILIASGIVCLIVSIRAPSARSRLLYTLLRAELLGLAGIGFTVVLYLASLITGYGLTANLVTKSFATTILLGCIVRIVQVWRQLPLIRQVLDDPVPADPPPAADPRD